MQKVLDSIIGFFSEYDVFNCLLPGYAFFIAVGFWTGTNNLGDNMVATITVSYVCGLVMNRIGSLVLEDLIIARIDSDWKNKKRAKYDKYIITENKDKKIEILAGKADMFRTISATSFTSIICVLVIKYILKIKVDYALTQCIIIFVLGVLFAFSYVKQVGYVKRRVDVAVKKLGGK